MTETENSRLAPTWHGALDLTPSEGCPPPHPNPRRPTLILPPQSCDSHCHVFGPATIFPYSDDRTFTPAEAPLEKLMGIHELLGVQRAVIVQSSCYGYDHRVLLDALERGAGRYRGVGHIHPDTSRAEINRLDVAGVRGFRVHFLPHLPEALSWDEVEATARLVADLGWHAEIHVRADGIERFAKFISRLSVPAVIDHLGRVDAAEGLRGEAFATLRRLLDTGRVWVKTSGADRTSHDGPPYGDAVALAANLVAHAPERTVWGTDYPHPNIVGRAPDDGLLVDLLSEIAPRSDTRWRLLVANPTELFDFEPVSESNREANRPKTEPKLSRLANVSTQISLQNDAIATSRSQTPRVAPVTMGEYQQSMKSKPAAPFPATLNITRTWARHPELMAAQQPLQAYFRGSTVLPGRDSELVILRIGWRCKSRYEFGQHTVFGLEAGLTGEEITRVTSGPDDPGWTPFQATLLRAVDELYEDNVVSDVTWAQLSERYNVHQLIELLSLIGRYWAVSVTLNSLRVQLEPGTPGYPDEHTTPIGASGRGERSADNGHGV